jgi:hypothetical protein
MPAKSKAQARFMGAVAGGKAKKKPKSLSKSEAKEFIRGQKMSKLPEKVKKKKSSNKNKKTKK